MRNLILILLLVLPGSFVSGQELQCNVQVLSSKIQGTNKQVFTTMQTALYEFMNNTAWTNHVFKIEERIECNIMINITEQLSVDQFKGEIQLQLNRPVFNSSYNSVLLNMRDNDVQFQYVEFEPLEFNPSSFTSNLTSLMAYYAYIILGYDYDSYSLEGGTPFFKKAEQVVNNAQYAVEQGWKAHQSNDLNNRYWIVNNILNKDYRYLREFNYRYHRLGFDIFESKQNEARAIISESIKLLQKLYRAKPDPYMHLLQMVFDAKRDEFINIVSEGSTDEKTRIIAMLSEMDATNADKYRKALIQEQK